MRTIEAVQITEAIAKLAVDANYYLTSDVFDALVSGQEKEESPLGKDILGQIIKNACIARDEERPICQDTGMSVIFMEIGQDVHIIGGNLEDAVNAGVAKGYTEGYLRKSIVGEPMFDRVNTKNNTPAMLHVSIVPGDKIKIVFAPKGGGSENMSTLKMFKPSDGVEAVKKFVLDTITAAGSNPCPPIVIGIGVGGTMEKAAILSKKALARPLTVRNSHPDYAALEQELLVLVNNSGIGPQGLGGRVTALAVNIEYYPTHIACMPVAININCHATRHAEIEL
ncbi:fumarate hydratase [Desulfosporosinus nitroreducens]|uniref:Fumarate hydratase n=1 Tax=Desulfosporosinus nitroreducens TaxID=2018668 RepID=A0ABT8QU13_9FIRM|nr:fumarate hydratase [Desulfosporosinus nitroreducens]MDO0824858.1 fumarate hydratase [Desulfosporosinus nitroreducens]